MGTIFEEQVAFSEGALKKLLPLFRDIYHDILKVRLVSIEPITTRELQLTHGDYVVNGQDYIEVKSVREDHEKIFAETLQKMSKGWLHNLTHTKYLFYQFKSSAYIYDYNLLKEHILNNHEQFRSHYVPWSGATGFLVPRDCPGLLGIQPISDSATK